MMRNVIFFLLLFTYLAYAQSGSTTGAILGTVKDGQGAILAGATVVARQVETNQERTLTVGEDGRFQFLQLPPGTYEVRAEVEGFQTQKDLLSLNIGITALIDFVLLPIGVTEVVEVEAKVSEQKTESSSLNGSDRIDNLPINRRNFLDFATTAARVVLDRLPVQGVAATSGLSFNAQSSRQNNITIDGLDNNDTNVGTVRSTFSQEAVREFQVVSDGYSAEFGRALGGIVNIVTKGGTNDVHGTSFLFLRNDAISARNAFSKINPEYEQYQFGMTIGGPIRKDKLFYFTSFERLSVKQNNVVTIPDNIVASIRRLGFKDIDNGPQPFALGNTTFLGRIDAQINPSDSLTIRYNFGGTFDGNFEPFGGLTARSASGFQRLIDDQLAISNTYLGSNFINETRFLYGYRDQKVLSDYPGPLVRIEDGQIGRIVFGKALSTNQPRKIDILQIVNNVSTVAGPHQLKFGVDFLYLTARNRLPNREQGGATFADLDLRFLGLPGDGFFTAIQTFDPSLRSPAQKRFLTALASLLPRFAQIPNFPGNLPLADLPIPSSYGQGFFPKELLEVSQKFFSLFIQDDYKVTEHLLVKLGLRYDLFRTDFYPKNKGNFSPRIAISYNPPKLQRFSFYLTYGFFYAVPNLGPIFTVFPEPRYIPFMLLPETILAFNQPGRSFPVSDTIPQEVGFVRQYALEAQIQPDLHTSYTQQLGLGFNYFFNRNTVLNVSYNFVRGIRLFGLRDVNPVVRPGATVMESLIKGRIDPTRGSVTEFGTTYDSYFHGFTLSLNRRLSNRIGVQANYTLSKAIDNTFDFVGSVQEIENVFNLRSERALSVQDLRHRFVMSGTWDIGYHKLLKNFMLSGIVNINSGRPYNLVAGVDLNRNDIPFDRPLEKGPDGVLRPLGRNAGISPGFSNVDLRLARTLNISEKYKLSLYTEAFNLLNHVNIDQFSRLYPRDTNGNFNLPPKRGRYYTVPPDRYRSAFSPRLFQFGVRLSF
ncbi:MAG: TonB-dependent receptor [Acidobacteriota bacterium]|nr:TonB-dependent receptor [Acidobacteriota bacterium]